MVWAFGRLILLALVTTTILIMAVLTLNTVGQGQSYAPLRHPLAQKSPLIIAFGGDTSAAPPQSKSALSTATLRDPNLGLGITLRLSADKHWVLYGPQNLADLTDGKGFVGQHTLEELKKFKFLANQEPLLELQEALQLFPERFFYIEVYQPRSPALDEILKIVLSLKAEERVVVTSPFLDTLQELRKLNYKWLTGTSTSERAKANFLTSIFLETTVTLPGDVFVTPHKNSRLIDELLKRKKIILLETQAEKEIQSLKADAAQKIGLLTTRPGYYF